MSGTAWSIDRPFAERSLDGCLVRWPRLQGLFRSRCQRLESQCVPDLACRNVLLGTSARCSETAEQSADRLAHVVFVSSTDEKRAHLLLDGATLANATEIVPTKAPPALAERTETLSYASDGGADVTGDESRSSARSPSPASAGLRAADESTGEAAAAAPHERQTGKALEISTRTTRLDDQRVPSASPADDGPPIPPQPRDPKRYQLLAEHGRGGLGRVYRAHDRELGRDVALKELLQPTHHSEARFFREVLITARLEHPGIVPVHEAGRWPDGTPFYSMKLVAGRPLGELLAEAEAVGARLALLPHLIAVADAIAYAHDRQIIHRDLKPSNVIVGDFGETIVIDWGLAKELTAADDDARSGPYRAPMRPELTGAGSVMGTPAYMSPEQSRGARVDKRTDVYSLGAMLFQLCTGAVPPRKAAEEDISKQLRRVPEDLAAIAIKALSSAPDDRYPDAAALARDLRAYDAGARIAAREYSLLEMLGHWIRHHKRLTISVALPTAIVAVLGGFALREIISRGDRAAVAQQQAEEARDEILLKHAELLLKSDPTSAAAVLTKYSGNATGHRDFLLSEAKGRGVARIAAQTHRDTVFFLRTIDNDIISASADGRVVRTTPEGLHTLARDFGNVPVIAYDAGSRTLIYGRRPGGVAILHLDGRPERADLRHTERAIVAVAISPDGQRIAAIDQAGFLAIESSSNRDQSEQLPLLKGARRAAFADATTLVVLTKDSVISIDVSRPSKRRSYAVPGNELATELAIRDASLAIGTRDGSVHIIDLKAMRSTLVAKACEGTVNSVKFIPGRQLVAFACQQGWVGTIELKTGSARPRFPTERAAYALATSLDGRLLVAGGESAIVYVYDIETSFVTPYRGHAATISVLTISGDDTNRLLSADVNGAIRVWDAPRVRFRQLFRGTQAIFHAVFSPDGEYLVADGADGIVRMFDLTTDHLTELEGHTDAVLMTFVAPDSDGFVTLSYDGSARRWLRRDPSQSQVMSGHRGAVQDLCYLDSNTPVTSGTDGRLLAWHSDGKPYELFRAPESFLSHECLSALDAVVVATSQGKLYLVANRGGARILAAEGAPITILRAAPDGRTLVTGTSDGTVRVYQHGINPRQVLQAAGSIGHIDVFQSTKDSLLLSIASDDGRAYMRTGSGAIPPGWFDVLLPARSVRFSPNGDLLAVTCNDGGVWYYSILSNDWTFTQPHQTDVFSGRFSPDGKYFVSSDGAGAVILHDLSQLRM